MEIVLHDEDGDEIGRTTVPEAPAYPRAVSVAAGPGPDDLIKIYVQWNDGPDGGNTDSPAYIECVPVGVELK